MTSSYPAAPDTLPDPMPATLLSSAEAPHAELHTATNSAIRALQATLGVNPQGSASTVGARMDGIDAALTAGLQAMLAPREAITIHDSGAFTATGVGSAPVNATVLAAVTTIHYFTSAPSGHLRLNITGTDSQSMNSVMAVGEATTVVVLLTNGTTPRVISDLLIDGTAVTPKYQYGAAFTSGNASSIDVYSFDIIKTASAAFTVFASMTKFA